MRSAANPRTREAGRHAAHPEDLLQEGVVCGKAVVGGGGAREQQPHRVALVPKGGLHADEHIAKLLAVDEHLLAVGVEVAGGLAPVLLQRLAVRAQALVLVDGHLVGNVQVCRRR
jgi:hypothetical protein